MSWDIIIQALHAGVETVADIPDDFVPAPLPLTRSALIEQLRAWCPMVNFDNPSWGVLETADFSIEFNLGDDEALESFSLHVLGDEPAAAAVADLLERLAVRAIDTQSDTGLFDPACAASSMSRWRDFLAGLE